MQAQQMLFLARKYAHIFGRTCASGIQALMQVLLTKQLALLPHLFITTFAQTIT
jgi:hypothetical protein